MESERDDRALRGLKLVESERERERTEHLEG